MACSARDHKNVALYAHILQQMHHPCGYYHRLLLDILIKCDKIFTNTSSVFAKT